MERKRVKGHAKLKKKDFDYKTSYISFYIYDPLFAKLTLWKSNYDSVIR